MPSFPDDVLLDKKMKFRDSKPILPTSSIAKRDGSSSLRRPSQLVVTPKINLNHSLKPRHSVMLQPTESFGAEKEILATKKDRLEHIQALKSKKTVKRGTIAASRKSFQSSSMSSSDLSDGPGFDNLLDKRATSIEPKILRSKTGRRDSVASVEPLFEPRIYANRLLGRKINLKDVVIMKNVNGKIVSTIVPKNEMEVLSSK